MCLSAISKRCYCTHLNSKRKDKRYRAKITTVYVILFSLAFAAYNKLLTENSLHDGLGGDRLNYRQDFYGRATGYAGYDFYDELIHKFTEDFNLYMYITTFICCIGIFTAYNLHKITNPKNLRIMMCTPIVFFTFTGYKQCMSSIFVMLFFSIMSYEPSWKRNILAILSVVLACSFHSTAYLLIPLFFLLQKDRKYKFGIVIIVLVAIFFFIEPLCRWIANILSPYLPILSRKLLEYFNEDSEHANDGTTISVLKGFPYYFLLLIGFLGRKKLHKKIQKYDTYLLLTMIAAMSYAASVISYWFSRMTAVFYLPVSIFALLVIENEDKPKNALLYKIIFVGSLSFFTFRSVFLTFYNFGGY